MSLKYKIRTIRVTSEMIRKRRIIVSVDESITELDEVVVTPDNAEKFLDLKEEEFKGLFKKIPQNVDWSELSKYEQQDYTVASQELACSADGCEIVDL